MSRYIRPLRSDELYHWGIPKEVKYIAKIGKGKDARYFYSQAELRAYQLGQKVKDGVDTLKKAVGNENMYNVKPKNYNEKKKQIQSTDEWKAITKDKKSEYRKVDDNGKEYYDYDQYLVDKKHPILDAIRDYGAGRKVELRKQNVDTVVAGVKDYAKMAENTVRLLAGVSVGILTMKVKNNQGSYEGKKKQFKSDLKSAIDTYDMVKETASTYKDSQEAKNAVSNAKNIYDVNKQNINKATANAKKEITSKNITPKDIPNEAISAYARREGISEAEVKKRMKDATKDTLYYYYNMYRSSK